MKTVYSFSQPYETYSYVIDPDTLSRMQLILEGLAVLGRITIAGVDYVLGVAKPSDSICICRVGYKFANGVDSVPTEEVLFNVDTGLGFLISIAEKMSQEEVSRIASNVGLNISDWKNHEK